MLPTLYEGNGGLGVHTYGLFIMLAFCAAFLVTHTKATSAGIHPVRLIPVYLAASVGGLIGGRVLYSIAVEPGLTGLVTNPVSLFQGSGFAFYGGLIGGFLAVAAVAIPSGIPPWKLADIAAPSVLMGYGVGRLGCFFAGCCHGSVAPIGPDPMPLLPPDGLLDGQIWISETFPWVTTEFFGGVGEILNQPLYPTQLYQAAYGIGLSALMLSVWSARRFDGQLAAAYLLFEPVLRISVEAFRADPRGYTVTFQVGEAIASALPGMSQAGQQLAPGEIGLTTSQTIGLGMVVVGAAIYAARRNAGVAPEIPFDPDAELDED